MSTHSIIAMQTTDGHRSIYCHFDGYPEGVGAVLKAHYTEADKIRALMDLGDLSAIGPEIGEAHDFNKHDAETGTDSWCLAYGRDRGEKGTEAQEHEHDRDVIARMDDCGAEYAYLWDAEHGWRMMPKYPDWRAF